jgi:hypothetical protein
VTDGHKLKDLGGSIAYPMVNNYATNYTILTFLFDAKGTMSLVKCNKIRVDRKKLLSYEIPREFYLYVDIYYRGMISLEFD